MSPSYDKAMPTVYKKLVLIDQLPDLFIGILPRP